MRENKRNQKKLKEVVKLFSEGNTVGVKIHYADRTHTDVRLLPRQVSSAKTPDNAMV